MSQQEVERGWTGARGGLWAGLAAGLLAMSGCADEAAGYAPEGDRYAPEAPGQPDAGAGAFCDCPTGYTCELGVCKPPERETDRTASDRPPVASPRYVWALNPTADAVARIDPATLAIEAIEVGPQPVDLVSLPGEDAAVVLSVGDTSLSILDATRPTTRVVRVSLRRAYGRLSVSPDGAFAVAYPDPTAPPAGGAEGVLALVDLRAARAGRPLEEVRFERAAGYRVTDVVFQTRAGASVGALIFAKQTVTLLDLLRPAEDRLPARMALPAAMAASVEAREVIATADGAHVVLRSTVSPELAWFDGGSFRSVPLPEVATDIDLTADGSAAVAALRASARLAYLRIPEDLIDPSGIRLLSVGGTAVGQVVLPQAPAGGPTFALVYSNAAADETFSRVDLPSGETTVYAVQKWVEQISLSPDGRSALLLHRANPGSTASDPYEKAVDRDGGYSTFDVGTGYLQLKRTGRIAPGPFAFSSAGGYVGVALRDDLARTFTLDAVDLGALVATPIRLASAPLYMGPVPSAPGTSAHRVFVSQSHSAGRISVVGLDDGQVRTATGFTLNSEIE